MSRPVSISSYLLCPFGENVEEKGFDVEVERFVVEKELGEQTETLAVQLVVRAVDFIDGEVALAVDFGTGRLASGAVVDVVEVSLLHLHVA